MIFEAEKDKEGYLLPDTMKISFKNRSINKSHVLT